MPRPDKRKKQLVVTSPYNGMPLRRGGRYRSSETNVNVPKEESSPVDAIVAPGTITSLHMKKRTPIATSLAESAINTALPDVVTSLPTHIATAIAEDDTNTALPDVVTALPAPIATAKAEDATDTALPDVVTSLPPTDLDVIDTNTDSVTDTQSNNHPRAIDPSTSTSMSALQINLEPIVKTETTSAPANLSTDQAEASIPMETVSNGPNLNPTVTVYRKATKRTFPWDKAAGELNVRSPSTKAREISARKKPRVVEPLPTTTNEAARKTSIPDVSEGVPSLDTPPSTDTVNASTCRRSRRQIQLRAIETSEVQSYDTDDANADDCDLSGPACPPEASVNAPTRRRSRRQMQLRAIETSEVQSDDADDANADHCDLSGPASPPDASVNAPTTRRRSPRVLSTSNTDAPVSRRSRRQTQRPPIETREAQLDDSDEFDGADDANDADFPSPSWGDFLSELADYRKIHGNCNVPRNYSENSKLANWVKTQRKYYRWKREGKRSPMTLSRIQDLESLGFEWDPMERSFERACRLSQKPREL
jgi:hypothetical protein